LILAFIGVKLTLLWGHGLDDRVPEISTNLSLEGIVVVLTATTDLSLLKVRRDPGARAHPGSLTAGGGRHRRARLTVGLSEFGALPHKRRELVTELH
jgi:hypothetical protein